ncbi:tyrosine-type recombinase/integrase [Povalibacter sp.]|uniref:tyrosine-type recombinase/integrase n=1 Tax=Povalibacter sp. TaxID=1962978 RepID=UPI002F40EF9E
MMTRDEAASYTDLMPDGKARSLLPAKLLCLLKARRAAAKDDERGPLALVCLSARGKPMHASALLQRGLHPALEHARIRQVRYHDLRHSFASNLLAAGVDIVTVSKALGHANVQITLTIYAHAVPKPRYGASDRMAALMETIWKHRGGKAAASGVKGCSANH